MRHRILFLDMDGTMYQTEKDNIQESTLLILKKIRNQGMQICASTGRGFDQMDKINKKFLFDQYVLVNGTYVIDSNNQVIYSDPLKEKDIEELTQICIMDNYGLLLKCGNISCAYSNFTDIKDFAERNHLLNNLVFDVTHKFHYLHPAYACIVIAKNPKSLWKWVSTKRHLQTDQIRMNANGSLFDVFNRTADKTTGIQVILNKNRMGWKDVICIGDSGNDLKMIQKADIGIAMGNARENVKAIADHITTTVNDNGVANALNHLIRNNLI